MAEFKAKSGRSPWAIDRSALKARASRTGALLQLQAIGRFWLACGPLPSNATTARNDEVRCVPAQARRGV